MYIYLCLFYVTRVCFGVVKITNEGNDDRIKYV